MTDPDWLQMTLIGRQFLATSAAPSWLAAFASIVMPEVRLVHKGQYQTRRARQLERSAKRQMAQTQKTKRDEQPRLGARVAHAKQCLYAGLVLIIPGQMTGREVELMLLLASDPDVFNQHLRAEGEKLEE